MARPAARNRHALTWVPTTVVLVTVIASLTVPLFVFNRIERIDREIARLAEPARNGIETLLLQLAVEISNFRGHLLTGSGSLARRYHETRATGEAARRDLAHYLPTINERSRPHVEKLNRLFAELHATHDRFFAGELTRDEYINQVPDTQELFAEIAGEIGVLQEMVANFQRERRREIDETVRNGGIAIGALVLVGLFAAMTVSRLSFRLDNYSAEIERRAREELAFRRVASGLNAAASVADVLRQVSESAAEITDADGAYVERILPGGSTVEVVATVGSGTPPRGTIVPYPGSLTDEILSRREPVLARQLGEIGHAIAPYLEKQCGACEILVVPLFSEEEELGALVLLISDVEAKEFREEDVSRAKALGDLAAVAMRRVSMLDRERRARKTAEELLEKRDELLSVVSHDLRAPLTTIALSVQMLEISDKPQDIDVMKTAVGRMERLIDDLLDTARIESGRLSLRRKDVEPRSLLDDACRAYQPLAENKHLRLTCDSDSSLRVVSVDPDRMMQVFGNLIGNAVKFTPEGGEILVTGESDAGSIRFSVIDSGPGIPPADLPNIFRPHWQAKKTAHLGAGLGLSIAKGIVEAHGGTMWADNVPGRGAAFHFTIPVE